MKKILFYVIFCSLFTGCSSRYQYQMDQSLLLQENQRLEEALYVTHAQLVDLKRENEALKIVKRTDGSGNSATPVTMPALRSQRYEPLLRDDFDEAPPFQAPQVTIPENETGTETLPDSLKGGLLLPPWSPTRN